MIQFAKFTKAEADAVQRIMRRAQGDLPDYGFEGYMDLAAVHAHTPLDLGGLADAEDFDFWHDIGGIRRHIDRSTGKLGGCFVPRYTRKGE